MRTMAVQSSPEETYHLHKRDECVKFVERYKRSEHLAAAIILSTFSLVRLSDLSELEMLLLDELSPTEAEKADTRMPKDPYISVNTLLAVIHGEWSKDQEGLQYVGLGKHSRQALQMIWEQFPALRDPIRNWLFHLYQVYSYRTTFDAYQIVCAFARMISLDFEDSKRRIFPRLFSDRDYTNLLASVMYKLYEEISLRQEIENMLLNWVDSKSDWLWRPAFLACSSLMPQMNEEKFDSSLKRKMRQRLAHLTRYDSRFIAALLMQSQYFRTMLAGLLGKMIRQEERQKGRLGIAQTYLYLLRFCYYFVSADRKALPLAACDTAEQQRSLSPVVGEVLSQVNLRRQLLVILSAYMKELSHYQYDAVLLNHLSAFFYNMVRSNPDYWSEILQFLYDCSGKLPRQIYDCLCSKLPLSKIAIIPQ